jgi:hypothetical protein
MIATALRRFLGFGPAWDPARLRIDLSDRTDAFGFRYGWVHVGRDRTHRLDVLPPADLFDGDDVLEVPDPRLWLVFVDGEERAGMASLDALPATLARVFADE